MNEEPLSATQACVFDAYGTLFDVNAAAQRCAPELGPKWQPLSQIWRAKQLEYSWLLSLRGDFADFWHVTGQSLDYALAAVEIDDPVMRSRLMELYFTLDAYPDAVATLTTLKATERRTAILSNGAKSMLVSSVKHAGIHDLVDHLFSVDDVEIYKPHPKVYQMAVDGLGVEPHKICFVSANAWDVSGAAHFGFRVVWINRFGARPELTPGRAEHEITSLAALPPLLDL